jgi:hypothetical protein
LFPHFEETNPSISGRRDNGGGGHLTGAKPNGRRFETFKTNYKWMSLPARATRRFFEKITQNVRKIIF